MKGTSQRTMQHHLLGRDGGHQRVMDGLQLGVGVARPQHGVVRGFFHMHVVEVLGNEQRQVTVQRQHGGGPLRGRRAQQAVAAPARRQDVGQVVVMLMRDHGAGAGGAGFQRGWMNSFSCLR
jgi:hypothetical protein